MKLTIYRGTHEIGGSCLELSSNSGRTRVIIDIGLPLVNADGSPFDWDFRKEFSIAQLLSERTLPSIIGLYEDVQPSVNAVLISHAHLDHYGLLRYVHPDIPRYMSRGTGSLVEVSNIFPGVDVTLDNVKTFTMWQPFPVGEFVITPYLVDHSAPDAAAFLIEGDGQRIFYTGDFRGHGRKGVLLERITQNPPANIDYLIMEGSMLGRTEGLFLNEAAVEEGMCQFSQPHDGPYYVFTSSQNLDRLVSIYRAARRNGKIMVIDLYTAFVLDKLSRISTSIPQFSWEGIRVLFSHYHAVKLAEQDKKLLYKYRQAKIEFEEIHDKPTDKIILAKDSRYFRIVMDRLSQDSKGKAIYSMWHGYLERSDLRKFLQSHRIELTEIHTSGHAYINQLKKLAGALKPRFIIPMHTFYPEKYSDLFPNVIQLKDGEEMTVDRSITTDTLKREVTSKLGKPGGWPKYFKYDLRNDSITITFNMKDIDKKASRRLDPWGLAFLIEAEAKVGIKVSGIKFALEGPISKTKQDNRLVPDLEAFRRRVSFLSINNQYLRFEITLNGEPVALDDVEKLFNRPQNEIIRESFNRKAQDNQAGRLEKDFQTWLFANDIKDEQEKAENTNERLAVLGEDFYQLKKRKFKLIREFPTGVFHGKITNSSRILPTKFVDIVSLNKHGNLAVIELKLNDSQLEVIAQLLDYSLFFRCFKDKLLPIIKWHLGATPNNEDLVCYVVNNHFHPKFDAVLKYYSTKGKSYGFQIKKVALGCYTE